MPVFLVYTLLALALVVPVLGVIGLRLLGARLDETQVGRAAVALFAAAMLSALLLSRSDVTSLRVGGLTLLLPSTRFSAPVQLPPDVPIEGAPPEMMHEGDAPPATPVAPAVTATLAVSPTPAVTATPGVTATATVAPVPTPEPTVEPTATPEPTAPPAAGPRRYTVQAGDTLRGIAEQFGVTVQAILQANNLTPEQADSLRPGQEIIIP